MNRMTAIALIALTTGCATDGVSLQHEGTIWSEARGVAFQDDGLHGLPINNSDRFAKKK